MSGQGQSSHAPATLRRADDVREKSKAIHGFLFRGFRVGFSKRPLSKPKTRKLKLNQRRRAPSFAWSMSYVYRKQHK